MALSVSAQLKIKLKRIHARVTRNRLTTTFFVFGVVHCFAQGILQSLLFSIDSEYSTFLTAVTNAGQIDSRNHTNLLGGSGDFQLEMCNFIPHNDWSCSSVFVSGQDSSEQSTVSDAEVRGQMIEHNLAHGFSINSMLSIADNTTSVILESGSGNVTLSHQCISILLYPAQHLMNSRREDLAFVFLQFWLFIISTIAMIYDSVPHILTVLCLRVALTGWSIYDMWRTEYQQEIFRQLIEAPETPCRAEMFGYYFATRIPYEVSNLILNCTALGLAGYLSWVMIRAYNTEAFKCVGAPEKIMNMYKYFLALQVVLQLQVFVSLTAGGLWIDQLFNTYIKFITNHLVAYEAVFIVYTIFLVPWIAVGWFGIRYEHRAATIAFAITAFIFVTYSAVMFYSQVYRWTYYAWPCWGIFTTASLVLLVASFVLGIVCYSNFNKGLAQYLHVEAVLNDSDFATEVFEHTVKIVDEEKTPPASSRAQPIPTFYLPTLNRTASASSSAASVTLA